MKIHPLSYENMLSLAYKRIRQRKGMRTVYFIGASELSRVKIGIANNVSVRLKQLQAASPSKLVLRAIIDRADDALEKTLHDTFAHKRLWGEWFDVCEDMEEMINLYRFRRFDNDPPLDSWQYNRVLDNCF